MFKEIGSQFRETRNALGITLDEVHVRTKIQKSFLEDIERGQFDKLPSPFYVRTYIRSYANCIKIEPQHILRKYRKAEQSERLKLNSCQEYDDTESESYQTESHIEETTACLRRISRRRTRVDTAVTVSAITSTFPHKRLEKYRSLYNISKHEFKGSLSINKYNYSATTTNARITPLIQPMVSEEPKKSSPITLICITMMVVSFIALAILYLTK